MYQRRYPSGGTVENFEIGQWVSSTGFELAISRMLLNFLQNSFRFTFHQNIIRRCTFSRHRLRRASNRKQMSLAYLLVLLDRISNVPAIAQSKTGVQTRRTQFVHMEIPFALALP